MNKFSELTIEKNESRLLVRKAATSAEIESAMRLRFEIFNLELNEGLLSSYETGLDQDEYDSYCDHIVVMDDYKSKVIGTYRLLLGSRADKGIGHYAETEFNLAPFKNLKGEKLELGRACIHRDYRGSTVLGLMWGGIAQYMELYNARYLFGCGSIHTINPHIINSLYTYLKTKYLAEEKFLVSPVKTIPDFDPEYPFYDQSMSKYIPNLLKAYLRIGARIAGEPAFDDRFGVTDFLIVLKKEKIMGNYRRRYCS